MTVQDELTGSQRAPNERVLFRTHPCFKVGGGQEGANEEGWYEPSPPHPHHLLCAIPEVSH